MSQANGGQLFAEALHAQGVEHLFTLCGGHIAPIYLASEALGARVVDLRHEQAAVMAADGYARALRKPGVAVITAGPGVTNGFTGIVNAQLAGSPVLCIGGQSQFEFRDMGALQEMSHLPFIEPVTTWARSIVDPARIPDTVAKAMRRCSTGSRGVSFIEAPMDLLMAPAQRPTDVAHGIVQPVNHPAPTDLDQILWLLERAERPMVLAGSKVYWDEAWEPLARFAEAAAVPVYTNGMGRGTLPPSHPYFFQHSRSAAMKEADVILLIGAPLDFRLGYGRPPKLAAAAKIIQLDDQASALCHNRDVAVGLTAHAGVVLDTLATALEPARDANAARTKSWRAGLRKVDDRKLDALIDKSRSDATPVYGWRFCREVAEVVDESHIVIGDGGDIVACASKLIPALGPGSWMDPGPFGCLGVGVPFAIGAKLARPDKNILLVMGDGSVGFNGFDFDSAVRQNIPFVAVVGNDAAWGQIRGPQISFLGEDAVTATELSRETRYDRVVEALGGHGERVEDPAEIGPAIRRAFESGLPALVDVQIERGVLSGAGYMRGL